MAVLLDTNELGRVVLASRRFSLRCNRPSSYPLVHLDYHATFHPRLKLDNVVWILLRLVRPTRVERGEDRLHANFITGYDSVVDGHAKVKFPPGPSNHG